MRDGSSGIRRGGLTNLSFVVVADEIEDLFEGADFEDKEAASAATSLVRQSAVLVALVASKASVTEKKSSNNVPAVTRWSQAKEGLVFIVVRWRSFNSRASQATATKPILIYVYSGIGKPSTDV